MRAGSTSIDQRDAAVHGHRERLGAAHAAQAGGDATILPRERPAEMPPRRPRRAFRRCPAGCPASRCRSSCRPSSGRTSSGRDLRDRGTCPTSPISAPGWRWRSARAARRRCVLEHADRLARLHEQRFVVRQRLAAIATIASNAVPDARGLAGAAVDDQIRRDVRRPRDRDCSSTSAARLPVAIPGTSATCRAARGVNEQS